MTRVVISLVALVFAATCLVSAAWVLLLVAEILAGAR